MSKIFYDTCSLLLRSNNIEVEIVPTPVQDKAYCGVCVQVDNNDIEKIRSMLLNMEYIEVEDEWGFKL